MSHRWESKHLSPFRDVQEFGERQRRGAAAAAGFELAQHALVASKPDDPVCGREGDAGRLHKVRNLENGAAKEPVEGFDGMVGGHPSLDRHPSRSSTDSKTSGSGAGGGSP